MDPSLVVIVSIALGFGLGAGFVWLLVVSARHRAQMRAMTNPQLPEGFDSLLSALESIVIIADPSHNVIQATPGATSKGLVRWGTRLAESVGQIADEARNTQTPVTRELQIPRGPFGTASLSFRVRAAPIAPRFTLILAEDRTEALRVESVRRDFVANVSHELKTPIGAIMLLSEALDEAADEPEQVRAFSSRLHIEGERLARLTQEIIELSRIQSTDSMLDADIVEVQSVLEMAVDHSRVTAEAKDIRVVLRADSKAKVYGNEDLLLTCVQNLVANAVQYSPEGSQVGVGARVTDNVVEISVTDQGIGIPLEDQERIFERFFRVDQARSRNTGGTGLGLSIVRHIVENHGGDIRVWSKVGQGSTFTIRIPTAESAAPELIELPDGRKVRRPAKTSRSLKPLTGAITIVAADPTRGQPRRENEPRRIRND